jgi:hypothetical protein
METNSEKKQYHEAELAKYRRVLKTCELHQHTGIMNWIAYHSIKVRELDTPAQPC